MNFEIDIERFLDELCEKTKPIDEEFNSEYNNFSSYEKFDFIFKSLTGEKSSEILFTTNDIEQSVSNMIFFINDLKEYFEENLNDNQFAKYNDKFYEKTYVIRTLSILESALERIYKITFEEQFKDTTYYQDRIQSFNFTNKNDNVVFDNREDDDISQSPQNLKPIAHDDESNTIQTKFTPDKQPTIQNDDVSEVVPLTPDLPLTPDSEIEALKTIIERLNKIRSTKTIYNESNIFNYCCQKIFGKNSNECPNLKKEDLIKKIDDILEKIEINMRLLPEQKSNLNEKLEAMKNKLNGKAMPKKNSSSFDKQINPKKHIGRPENKPPKENNDRQPKQSQRVNKFKIGNIDYKAYLSALKKYGPYALGGTAIGLAVSAITPGLIWSGFGTVRIVYSTAKFANKIWAKLSGGPTPIDKIVTKGLEYFKYKMNKSDFGFDMVRRIEKANIFLKKPKVQWLMTGFAVGYKLGEFFELNDKIKNIFNNSQSSSVTVPKDKMNFQTTEPEPTMPSTESNINETIPQQSTGINQSTPSRKPNFTENMSNVSMDSGTVKPPTPIEPVGSSNDYSWLDIGENGDKIDLTEMTKGYTDSYAATGAYKGQYEYLNKAVDLATKYATEANGTFISEIRLPNGGIFTGGNVGDLLDYLERNGIDPASCAANVCNSNGYYTWGNLEKVLEALSKGTGRGR